MVTEPDLSRNTTPRLRHVWASFSSINSDVMLLIESQKKFLREHGSAVSNGLLIRSADQAGHCSMGFPLAFKTQVSPGAAAKRVVFLP